MLASGVIGLLSFLLPEEAFISWGWRIAFILSAVLVLVGAYIRTSVQETQDFSSAKKEVAKIRYPMLEAFKRYPKTLTACVGARFVEGIAFNVFGVFSLTYLTNTCGVNRTVALMAVVVASAVMACFIPMWGAMADRVGKGRIFGTAALLLGITSFPVFWVLHNYATTNLFFVYLAIIVPFGIIYGSLAGAAGLTPWQTIGMSLLVFAGSAQFIAISLLGGGATLAVLWLTTLVVNLRHALYSASLQPFVRHLPKRWRVPLAFWLTDEAFAVVQHRYAELDASPHKHWYFLGAALAMYGNWQLCTLIGLWFGQSVPGNAGTDRGDA